MNDADINYSKEAFLNPWNLAFLVMAMLTAFVLSLLPAVGEMSFNLVLILAAAAELMYLGIVPRDERFQRVIRSRRAAEHAKPPSQKEVFNLLSKYSQRRYVRLRKLEKEIQANYRKLSYASQGILNSHLQKIDGLLDSYLNLLYQKERFEFAIHSSAESEVIRKMDAIRAGMTSDSPKVRAINERRLKILDQRLQRFKKGRENLDIIIAQLDAVDDVTRYIHEQSLTLRNPDEITFQLDTLLSDVEETQSSIEAIEDVFTNANDLLSGMDSFEAEGQTTREEQSRGRVSE